MKSLSLVCILSSLCLLPLLSYVDQAQARPVGGGRAVGARPSGGIGSSGRSANLRQGNANVNLQNAGNLGTRSANRPNNLGNRPPANTANLGNRNPNLSNTTLNNQGGNRVNNFDPNRTRDITRTTGNNNIGNTVNVDRNVVANPGNWQGGGWNGRGYYVPPSWGWNAAAFAGGLVIGAAINSAPPYYSNVYVNGTPYMYSDGVYLLPQSNSTYTVVAPPVGAVVSYLPEGCGVFTQDDVEYYDCSGVIYQAFYDNGSLAYTVVYSGS